MKIPICSNFWALIIIAVAHILYMPAIAAEAKCDDIRKLDFQNITIEANQESFPFHDGIALRQYESGEVFKANIEKTIIVEPANGVTVRFLVFHDSHETGSGDLEYVIGYECSKGALKKVFGRYGQSLNADEIDSKNVLVSINPIDNKPIRKHYLYAWDLDQGRYTPRSSWLTNSQNEKRK